MNIFGSDGTVSNTYRKQSIGHNIATLAFTKYFRRRRSMKNLPWTLPWVQIRLCMNIYYMSYRSQEVWPTQNIVYGVRYLRSEYTPQQPLRPYQGEEARRRLTLLEDASKTIPTGMDNNPIVRNIGNAFLAVRIGLHDFRRCWWKGVSEAECQLIAHEDTFRFVWFLWLCLS